MPHPAYQRSVALDQMGEQVAGLRPSPINAAQIIFQEDAAVFIAQQNTSFISRFDSIFAQEFREFDAQEFCQMLGIALRHLRRRHTATVRAACAVDSILYVFGYRLQVALGKVVALHPGAKTPVLHALFFAEAFNLDEIRQKVFWQTTPNLYSFSQENKITRICLDFTAKKPVSVDNGRVTDRLSLSIWLAHSLGAGRLRQFEKILRIFPFSQREQPQSLISVQAIDSTEPPLLERPLNGPLDPSEVVALLQNYSGEDVAYTVEGWWDLWQFVDDWKLAPARVALACFGPEFDNLSELHSSKQEDLRVDFGLDGHFLPQPDIAGSARLVESNIKSLLRVVHELDSALPVERRRLETETGENFADRLQDLLTHSKAQ